MGTELNLATDVFGIISLLLSDRKPQQNEGRAVNVCVLACVFYTFLKKLNQFQFLELKENTESYLGVSGWFLTINFPD